MYRGSVLQGTVNLWGSATRCSVFVHNKRSDGREQWGNLSLSSLCWRWDSHGLFQGWFKGWSLEGFYIFENFSFAVAKGSIQKNHVGVLTRSCASPVDPHRHLIYSWPFYESLYGELKDLKRSVLHAFYHVIVWLKSKENITVWFPHRVTETTENLNEWK